MTRWTWFAALLLVACSGPEETDTDTDTEEPTVDTQDTAPEPVVQWVDRSIETSSTLYDIYTGGTGAWTVGTEGKAWRIGGGESSALSTGTSNDLQGMWGSGDGDSVQLVAVGTSGTVLEYTTTTGWQANDELGTFSFQDIDALGSTLLAVSYAGAYRSDGSEWTFESLDKVQANAVRKGTSIDVAVGEDGGIVMYAAGAWEKVSSPVAKNLAAVHGIADNDIWAVGAEGTVVHFDGSTWSKVTTPVTVNLWGVWQADSGEVFVVGNNGTALMYDGAEWTELYTGEEGNLYAVHGSSATDVWAVGNRGLALRYTGPVSE